MISPLSGTIRPDSSLTMVDLPAPFSPSSACTSPGATLNEASFSATVAPKALRDALDVAERAGPACARCSDTRREDG